MKQNASSRRVNEQARQTIAEIFMFEVSDPRLSTVTITACEVSFDRSFCKVFYTTGSQHTQGVATRLERAAGKIRFEMARRLSWRVTPELRFVRDNSVDEAQRIMSILAAEEQRIAATEDGAYRTEASQEEDVADAVDADADAVEDADKADKAQGVAQGDVSVATESGDDVS